MGNKIKRFLSMVLILVMLLSNSTVVLADEVGESTQVESITDNTESEDNTNADSAAQNAVTGKAYDDVTEALSDAAENETVTLLRGAEASLVSVMSNVTLDLNGHTLEASYVTCFGNIVDHSADNTGLLKVSADRFLIQQNNTQLPVKNGEGYKFFDVTHFNTRYQEESSRYVFQPFIEKSAHELILQGTELTGTTINVRVSWTQADGQRSQDFVYIEEKVNSFLESYSSDNDIEKYGKMFTLILKGTEKFEDLAFSAVVVSDTGVEMISDPIVIENKNDTESGNVTADDNNQVAEDVTIQNGQASAVVNTGTQLEDNTTQLTLTVEEMDVTTSDITLGESEQMVSMDVHVEGVSEDNTVPVIITLDEIAPEYLNQGNLSLYHVENGETVEMTRVYSVEEVDAHNEFYYDTITGTVTMALATFSEISVVSDSENVWKGESDTSWYNTNDTEFEICNADQLVGLGKIVSGNGFTADNFAGKTIKLIADINIGNDTVNGTASNVFYPIGYWNLGTEANAAGEAEWYTYGGEFSGIFDGAGHTIKNIYQNTWIMNGDYDNGYYNEAMGLFGYIVGGSVKNLTIQNFDSDGEFAPTGCVTAYAIGNCTFENITLLDCNPATYNTGVAGIVGWDDGGDDETNAEATHYIFNNITIDNTNEIEALWGSWDVGAAGILGYLGKYSTAEFNNCHIAAKLNVFNDVCANYQYYWYRYCGMLIGTVDRTDSTGAALDLAGITATNCTVNFGDWNDYYYCELVNNSLASYTHDHQFSRLQEVSSEADMVTTGTNHYVIVDRTGETKTATCYHYINGKKHEHLDEGYETVDGVQVYKEDKQRVNLPFNQVFGGYGWGVKGTQIADFGNTLDIEVLGVTEGESEASVEKFQKAEIAQDTYTTGTTITVGELFTAIDGVTPEIDVNNVQVTVSPVDDTSTAGGTYVANTTDWTQGTLTFSGTGSAEIIISDYYFCKSTSLTITITEPVSVEKFDIKFPNTEKYLYRVGNQNSVSLSSLFVAKTGEEDNIGNVSVTVEPIGNVNAEGNDITNVTEWETATIQFTGTGPVKVTITDDNYSIPVELRLEVVNAKNITALENATSNNVVLLNDVSGGFTVSNNYTLYGNGFTVTLPTTVQSSYSAGYVGYAYLSGGNLDNVRIEGPVYPEMYIYRDQAQDSSDTTKANYFYNSILINSGNCTISNSYISGSRTAICIRGGNNVIIDNTTVSGGAYANIDIAGVSSVTLKDVTTVQTDVTDSYGQSKTVHGLGVAVESSVTDIYIEGELNQYNWLCEEQWNAVVPSTYQSSFPDFFGNDKYKMYWHYLNGGSDPYVNLAFVFACNWDTSKIHDNRSIVDYATCDSTIAGVDGGVYSKVNTDSNVITDVNLSDPGYTSPGFDPVVPVFNFDNTVNNEPDDENDAADPYCVYDEASGILKIGITGDSKTIDLSGVGVVKDGTILTRTAYLNGTEISGDSVTINADDGAKQSLTFKATNNDAGYDKDGNPIEGSIEYSWTVTVEIAVLAYPAPVWNMGGTYTFDTSNCYYAYYQTSQGYGEAVPIYEGIKVNYYNESGTLVELDMSGTTTLPTGSNNANANPFTYTLDDGSTLTMMFGSGWKSGATTHQFTAYNSKTYIYPQSLDNDNYVRAKTTNQDFNVKISYTFTDPNGQSTETVTMNWYNAAASNGSVSTVQWKTFDSINGREPECVTPDTLITLADGSQVRVDSLTGTEELLVWNLETGTLDAAPIMFIDSDPESEFEIVHLYFSDGTDVRVIYEHGFWDYDLNKYVYLDRDAAQYIGHTFAKQDGENLSKVTLTDVVIEKEVTTAWSPVTEGHLCYFVNGMLSMPGGVGGLFNIFDVDAATMTYDYEAMAQDIETYGLFTYEELNSIVPLSEEMFNAAGGAYLKVSIGKGNMTMDDLIYMIQRYSKYFE